MPSLENQAWAHALHLTTSLGVKQVHKRADPCMNTSSFSPAQNNIPSPFPVLRKEGRTAAELSQMVDARSLTEAAGNLRPPGSTGVQPLCSLGYRAHKGGRIPKTGPPSSNVAPVSFLTDLCGTRHQGQGQPTGPT